MTVRSELLQKALDHLGQLSLHVMDQDWVDTAWNTEFTEKVDLPVHYEEVIDEIDVMKTYQRLTRVCAEYCAIQTSANETQVSTLEKSMSLVDKTFWSEIIAQNVKSANLLALISYHLHSGLDSAANHESYSLSLVTAGLYLSLIALPGSGPYKIFHPVLFNKAFETIQVSKRLSYLQPTVKRRSDLTSSQSARGSQKRSRPSQRSSQMTQEDEEEEEDELSANERDQLTHLVLKLLDSVRLMLTHFSLKRSSESLELTIKSLIKIVKLETNTVMKISEESAYIQPVQRLAKSALMALLLIPNELHGDLKRCAGLLLQGLVPLILMVAEEGSSITNKGLNVIKDNCLAIVSAIVELQPDLGSVICVLIQHLAASAPDKTDYRREAADSILFLSSLLDANHYRGCLRWFLRFSMNSRTSARLVSLEVLGKLICAGQTRNADSDRTAERQDGKQEIRNFYLKFIFTAIYRRTMDAATTVRTHALKILGDITKSESASVHDLIAAAKTNTRIQENHEAWIQIIKEEGDNIEQALAEVNPLPLWKDLVQTIQLKALDGSAFVRRSALCVIENILVKSGVITEELLRVLVAHCRDPSLAVRKQIVSSLTELLLQHPTQVKLVDAWVQGCLPLVKDVESKVAEKLCESLYQCIFGTFVAKSKVNSDLHSLPWSILRAVEKKKMELYLSQAVSAWAKEGKITKTHIANLQTYLSCEESTRAWLLLSIITNYVPNSGDPKFVLQYFNTCLENPDTNLNTLLNVSKVLFASVKQLGDVEQTTLMDHLLDLVKTFRLPTEVISIAVDIITAIIKRYNPDIKSYNSAQEGWILELLANIEDLLTDQILEIHSHNHSEKTLSRYILTLGELVQLSYSRINKKLFLLLQCIVFFKEEGEEGPVFSQEMQCRFRPSDKFRALATGTLGKMCLQNEDQAKKIIPAFGQILDSTKHPAIKNNIMIVLSDMCVRYASLVDPLIPQMTACLKDTSLVVRRTALIQLIHLLQEDYLKIRGKAKFFLTFLQTLLDPSLEIQELTKFYIEQRLLKRVPNIMYTNFLEGLFFFNMYQGHERYNKFELSENEKESFVLAGPENTEKRYKLFRYMLQHMSDEEKLKSSYALTQHVLQGILDKKIGLQQGKAVLKDTFHLLSCEEINLSSLTKKNRQDEEPVEGLDQVTESQVREAVTKAVISNQFMRSVIEIIVPTVIELKKFLEANNSPFLEDLMNYLKKLMEEHKMQMSDILCADPLLAKEIAYDLKKLEERREAQRLEAERLAAEQRRRAASAQSSRHGSRSGSRPGSAGATPSKSTTSATSVTVAARSPGVALAAGRNSSLSATPTRQPQRLRVASEPTTPAGMLKKQSKEKVLQQMMNDFTAERRKSVSSERLKRRSQIAAMEASSGDIETSAADKVDEDGPGLPAAQTPASAQINGGEMSASNTIAEQCPPPRTPATASEMLPPSRTPASLTASARLNGGTPASSTVSGPFPPPRTPAASSTTSARVNSVDTPASSTISGPIPGPTVPETEGDSASGEAEVNKSKRISGKGMPRQVKTPKTREFHNRRAVSTPQVNKTMIAGNLTFQNETMDISSITVLSPASSIGASRDTDTPQDTSSFRFNHRSKDAFDVMVDGGNKENRRSSRRSKDAAGAIGKRKET